MAPRRQGCRVLHSSVLLDVDGSVFGITEVVNGKQLKESLIGVLNVLNTDCEHMPRPDVIRVIQLLVFTAASSMTSFTSPLRSQKYKIDQGERI
jgi:hypothetical protein